MNVHRIADPDRSTKVQRLRDVNCSRSGQARTEDGRDQAGRIQPMGDPGLEGGLGGKMLSKVNGVTIPCEFGEADDVGRGHHLREGLAHPNRQILKVQNPQFQHGCSLSSHPRCRLTMPWTAQGCNARFEHVSPIMKKTPVERRAISLGKRGALASTMLLMFKTQPTLACGIISRDLLR